MRVLDQFSFTAGPHRRDVLLVEVDGGRHELTVFDSFRNVNVWPWLRAGEMPPAWLVREMGLLRPVGQE